jgi:hypothetical protein
VVQCCICGSALKRINNSHLKKHGLTPSVFLSKYPKADRGIVAWNKNFTKKTHPGLKKMSETLRKKNSWNFSKWQKQQRAEWDRRRNKKFTRNSELAELIGIILGDGNITKYERTEAIRIVCHSGKNSYIKHIVELVYKVFDKMPSIHIRKKEKAVTIVIYLCNLSKRLNIPAGNKIKNNISIPEWIKTKKCYVVSCLKGLFETDGCFNKDPKNYTQSIELKNLCDNIRTDTYYMLKKLGFNPQISPTYVRLARKQEVYAFKDLIKFREY